MAYAALLPMLASMGQSGQSQQNSALSGVDPQQNGQDKQFQAEQSQGFQIPQQDLSAPANNNTGGAQVLSMLAKLGQQPQGAATQPSSLTAPPPAGNTQNPGQPPNQVNVPGQQTQTTGTQPVNSLGAQSSTNQGFGQFLMQLFGSNS